MQFYVSDEATFKKCEEAVNYGKSITTSGVAADDGRVKGFTGIVQSVDEDEKRGPKKRYRVTMPDAQITEPGNL
jgi:hypothetical protein